MAPFSDGRVVEVDVSFHETPITTAYSVRFYPPCCLLTLFPSLSSVCLISSVKLYLVSYCFWLLFSIALLLIESSLHSHQYPLRQLRVILLSLFCNTISHNHQMGQYNKDAPSTREMVKFHPWSIFFILTVG